MTISLTPDQIRWLEAEVAAGRLRSVEEGVRFAVAELMHGGIDEEDGLEWAKPLVDDALDEVAQGQAVPLEEARQRIDAHLRKIGAR
jgi:antitoxin ParD1/3/4